MGNFKHQSIRATDRDRDRDTDREQERDSRSSDKYDRGRPALSSMQQLRGKDRDVASHLGATSSRLASQSQQAPSNRQVDSRQPSKKKDGETREDWRRGSDNPRRDRDERDRPFGVRDSSRPRRDVSSSRRDRDDSLRDPGYRRDRDDRGRSWRDDGKRDENMSARWDREQRDRERDKSPHAEQAQALHDGSRVLLSMLS
ncbi:hypothetical protein EDD22DRAFT_982566 [Suillus occidentalis]|nr:hypothetical protein EDD22DRAFT_982566 [Suillus occidentalis]